jgi:hypothetical protein
MRLEAAAVLQWVECIFAGAMAADNGQAAIVEGRDGRRGPPPARAGTRGLAAAGRGE